MALSFEHTRRALAAMRLQRSAFLLLLACLGFALWSSWLVLGRVAVYVKSSNARMEVVPPPLPLNTAVEGTVAQCNLHLGQQVTAGTVLVSLEAHTFSLQADEARAILQADEQSLVALRAELAAAQRASDAMESVVARTRRAGELRVAANRATSALKQQENDVVNKLSQAELASKLDSLRTLSESEAQRLQVRVSSEQAALDTSTARMTMQDRIIQVSTLSTQVVGAENALAIEEAKLKTLEYEVERRNVRALADGVVTDVVGCAPGMSVTTATRLGTLLPHGEVRLVAYFEPRDVIGRVKPLQRAIVRVDNFPWTQFGTLNGTVREVGSEPRDGLVRVELGLDSLGADIPAMHGLVATAEVETERLSPAHLLLRMAGQVLRAEPPAPRPLAPATPLSLSR